MNYDLTDSWGIHGSDFEEFKNAVAQMAEITRFKIIPSKELGFFHEMEGREEKDGKVPVMRITAEGIEELNTKDSPLKVGGLSLKAVNEELYNESMTSNGFLVTHERQAFYVSADAKTTLLMRANLSGEYATQKSCLMTQTIMESLSKQEKGMTLVYREVNRDENKKDCKVFSFLSEKYTPLDMNLLPELAERVLNEGTLGIGECKRWEITQNLTNISVEFPNAGDDMSKTYGLPTDIIPGVKLYSSDTGQSSVIAYSTYRVGDECREVFIDSYSHKHMGAITCDEIKKKVDETLLKQIRKLPEAMAEKIGYVVGLQHPEADPKLNRSLVEAAMKNGSKALGLVKAIGQKRVAKLLEELNAEIDELAVYTEFDLAIKFMSLPSRVEGLSDIVMRDFQIACGKAPFVDYAKKTMSDPVKVTESVGDGFADIFDDIFLMPEDI